MEFHSQSVEDAYAELKSGRNGLTSQEAQMRLATYGKNIIQLEKKISPFKIFINQFKNLPVILLIIAAIISAVLGILSTDHEAKEEAFIDSFLIFTILIANALFGFAQEYKAEKSIEALKKLSAPKATVLRDGEEVDIPATDVVPGDVLVLQEGDRIAADARVIESISLYADESILTGESAPVSKEAGAMAPTAALAERKNMIYMSTSVTRGKGLALVVHTGLKTEVGNIADEIANAEEKTTPFQEETEELGKKIAYAVFGIIVLVAATEFILRGADIFLVFIIAISLAVAAIPEGLPAVVTLALAIGTNKMLKQNALMRKLATVQNLGSLDVICTDKTGTLTENTMTVTRIYHGKMQMQVGGKGRELVGAVECGGKTCNMGDIDLLLRCAVLCNDARITLSGHEMHFRGDPTEMAVLIPAYKMHYDVDAVRTKYKRVGEIPFSSDRKMMTTINELHGVRHAYVKGAVEIVLGKCTRIEENGKIRKITDADRTRIMDENDSMASGALRVLAFAYKEEVEAISEKDVEKDLVFVGLMGMIDPPREGVREAINDCRSAGIRVVMITGDNKLTAQAIGSELGFAGPALTGSELDALTDEQIKQTVEKTDIYARTSPKHKVLILNTLKANGHTVAMTGDGVNDAPALVRSDVGIAMGIRGTEVAKQASDMVLLDDNFISIRNSIELGRGIFDNIRKFVAYLLGANFAEVLVVFLAAMLGLGLPLLAAHLLWINLLTDGLPALALGVDPPAKNIMRRKPRKKADGIINRDTIYLIITMGTVAALIILAIFAYYEPDLHLERAQTMVFTSFVMFEMVKVYLVRQRYHTSELSNKWLHIAVISSILLQVLVIYSPLNAFFKIVPLGTNDWFIIGIGMAVFTVAVMILQKLERFIIKDAEP